MAKIETYADATPTVNDKILGTDVSDSNETKNFGISDVLSLVDGVSITTETTVSLSVAQIGALHTTPVTLVAAPGAAKFINVEKVYVWMDYQTTPWVTDANAVEIKVGDKVALSGVAFEQTASTEVATIPPTQNAFFISMNTALTISAASAITGGDSAATVYIKYSTINTV